jgi:ribosomal protein L11 methyltransferase
MSDATNELRLQHGRMIQHSAALMDYVCFQVIAHAGDEAGLTEAFTAASFTGFAFSTRRDGRLDLELYGQHGILPAAVVAALKQFGITLGTGIQKSEQALLAAVSDQQPCALCPGVWIDPTGQFAVQNNDVVLHIPASPAFGDGHHPSTRMAAELLRAVEVRNQAVIDVGCGTGVLGLFAAKRGALRVVMSDIDADSVRTAQHAAALNNEKIEVVQSDLLRQVPGGPYTVMIANLYADLLLEMAEDVRWQRLLPHGQLIISGVADNKCAQVLDALQALGFRVRKQLHEAWWNGVWLER